MPSVSLRYPLWLCDIWGVIHNGYTPFTVNTAALAEHRRKGGTVLLVTNSPRTATGVEKQLRDIGVDPASHDGIVTSGDVTRDLIVQHGGGKLFHLGPSRDLSIFEGLAVARVPLAEAKAVLCTGLFDDQAETPADYGAMLAEMRARDLEMICANPDKIVRKGDRILYCAGALADAYAALGGRVLMAGKPYAPIYDLAFAQASKLANRAFPKAETLAIGDGPETDIKGAADYGLDTVLVAGGILDAAAGLAAAEAAVKGLVPHARIIATLHDLGKLPTSEIGTP